MIKAIVIDKSDNVAMVTAPVSAGEEVYVTELDRTVKVLEDIKAGHKIALNKLETGGTAIKYGIPIGRMTAPVEVGGWVHSHNLDDTTEELCGEYCEQFRKGNKTIKTFPPEEPVTPRTMKAFPRKNGTFGIRNYLMVIPTIPGGNMPAEAISDKTGCIWFVCDRTRLEDGKITDYTKNAMIHIGRHANIYAVLVIGSAAEEAVSKEIYDAIAETGKPMQYITLDENDRQKTAGEGLAIVEGFLKEAAQLKREPVSMADFGLTVHCSGSDWTTAINGNAAVGEAADIIVKNGGKIFMTEWMEWSGSQHLMAEKCATYDLGIKLLDFVDEVRAAVLRETGRPVEYMNPAPGNKEAGLTTLVEKSTGTIRKAGSTPVQGILDYCEQPTGKGVWLPKNYSVWSPSTAVYGSIGGAQMSVLNTGLGMLYYEMPHLLTVRTTGNPVTFQNKEFLLDFDAGIAFDKPLAEVGEILLDYFIKVAEGEIEPNTEKDKVRAFNMYYYIEDEFGPTADRARMLPLGVKNYKENYKKLTDSVK